MRPKDPLPVVEQSAVVQNIPCQDFDARYVGETGKRLGTTLYEHQLSINREDKLSLVYGHTLERNRSFAFEKATVVGRANDKMDRLMLESCSSTGALNRAIDLHPAYQALRARLESVQTGPIARMGTVTRGRPPTLADREEGADRMSRDRRGTLPHGRTREAEHTTSEAQRSISPPSDEGEASEHADAAATTSGGRETQCTPVCQWLGSERPQSANRKQASQRSADTFGSFCDTYTSPYLRSQASMGCTQLPNLVTDPFFSPHPFPDLHVGGRIQPVNEEVRTFPAPPTSPRANLHLVHSCPFLISLTDSSSSCVRECAPNQRGAPADHSRAPAKLVPSLTQMQSLTDREREADGKTVGRYHQLLKEESLADRKPSELLRRMRSLPGGMQTNEKPVKMFLERLPADVQTILASGSQDLTVSQLTEMADRVIEVQRFQSPSVDQISTSSSTVNEHLMKQVSAMADETAFLKLQLARLTSSRSRSRRRSRSRPRTADTCWYHTNFGVKARRCSSLCYFMPKQGNQSARE
nr:unnamed protein product [Spirometra erinaceieuropaei]